MLASKEEKSKTQTTEMDTIDWTKSRCRQLMRIDKSTVDLFFSERVDEINEAKSICGDCELIDECYALAELRKEPWGVWGGELFLNGRVVLEKRGRGRPPKATQLKTA